MKNKLLIALLLISIFIAWCTKSSNTDATNNWACSITATGTNVCTNTSALDTAKAILQSLKDKDIQTLATYINLATKVRFSPYSYVNTGLDIMMDAQETLEAYKDTERVINRWIQDGSGEPINLTMQKYFQRFVYDTDFVNAPEVIQNQEIMRGNIINNVSDVYKNVEIIEFYIPGTNPKYGGMDRRSLTLVLKKIDEKWYLIGVIHNEWTT